MFCCGEVLKLSLVQIRIAYRREILSRKYICHAFLFRDTPRKHVNQTHPRVISFHASQAGLAKSGSAMLN